MKKQLLKINQFSNLKNPNKMKHLFLCAIACLLLCTACFEKDEVETLPPDVDILQCDIIQRFITGTQNAEPREPRATVKKYLKGNEYISETYTGGLYTGGTTSAPKSITAYRNSNCEFICSDAFGVVQGQYCSQSFIDSLVYIETVWIDER